MKHLIVCADPNSNGFCRKIVTTLVETLQEAKKEVVVRNLYDLKFDPVLSEADLLIISKEDAMADVKEEQEQIQDASVVTFVYPVWWLGAPAILKGYFDRVFSQGFAYSVGAKGLERGLEGKRAVVINIMGAQEESYEKKGFIEAMCKTTDVGILNYVGFEVIEHVYFGSISSADEKTKQEYLEEVKRIGEKMTTVGVTPEPDFW